MALPKEREGRMTKDEALDLALEALREDRAWLESDAPIEIWDKNDEAITAIKQARSAKQKRHFCERCGKRLGDYIHTCTPPAAPVQEPTEWLTGCPECGMDSGCDCDSGTWNPPAAPVQKPVALVIDGVLVKSSLPEKYTGHLYTTPPAAQRQWVRLTKTVVGNHLRRHALGDQSTFRQGFKEGVAFAELKLKEKNT